MIKATSLLFLTFSVLISKCQSMDDSAYSRYSGCQEPNPQNDYVLINFKRNLTLPSEVKAPKGFLGTIGIVGGGHTYTGKPFITAMTALRVGADAAHIFCTNAAGPAIQPMSPDIIVHPFLDTNFEKAFLRMQKMDVIVLGPGLDENGHSINVITRVVNLCKTFNKVLILHLEEYFLTQATVNLLLKFPTPGVILITNNRQFEKIYSLIKLPTATSDDRVHVKFDTLGNTLIMRTGCTDTAVSESPASSWRNSNIEPQRKTSRRNDMISGATATYMFWAIRVVTEDQKKSYGPMFPAAIATFSASKLLREVNKKALLQHGITTTAMNMIDKIHEVLYSTA